MVNDFPISTLEYRFLQVLFEVAAQDDQMFVFILRMAIMNTHLLYEYILADKTPSQQKSQVYFVFYEE